MSLRPEGPGVHSIKSSVKPEGDQSTIFFFFLIHFLNFLQFTLNIQTLLQKLRHKVKPRDLPSSHPSCNGFILYAEHPKGTKKKIKRE